MKYWIYRCRGKSVILSLGDFQKELFSDITNSTKQLLKSKVVAILNLEISPKPMDKKLLNVCHRNGSHFECS